MAQPLQDQLYPDNGHSKNSAQPQHALVLLPLPSTPLTTTIQENVLNSKEKSTQLLLPTLNHQLMPQQNGKLELHANQDAQVSQLGLQEPTKPEPLFNMQAKNGPYLGEMETSLQMPTCGDHGTLQVNVQQPLVIALPPLGVIPKDITMEIVS